MPSYVRELVRTRAGDRCEYCHIPQSATPFTPFHIEHVIARQHLDDDTPANLALACDRCNAYKGPNLSGIDPETGDVVDLFHPRKQLWDDHFVEQAGVIRGLTAAGRATVRLLQMNDVSRVRLRDELREHDP